MFKCQSGQAKEIKVILKQHAIRTARCSFYLVWRSRWPHHVSDVIAQTAHGLDVPRVEKVSQPAGDSISPTHRDARRDGAKGAEGKK